MIRLFIACAPDGQDAEFQAVAEHSLRSRTKAPLEIEWMRLNGDPESPWYSDGKGKKGWHTFDWTTPFTLFRYAIPARCGFQGKAIYADSDVLFRADIEELWNLKHEPGKFVIAKSPGRLCVSLWDCAAAGRHLPPLGHMMRHGAKAEWCTSWKRNCPHIWQPFPDGQNWNSLDGDGRPLDDTVKCVHFSDIATQPHMRLARMRLAAKGRMHWFTGDLIEHRRPDLVQLFLAELGAAAVAGYRPDDYDRVEFGRPFKMRDNSAYRGGHRRALS